MRHFSDEEILEGIIQERKDVLKHVYTIGFRSARHFVIMNGGSELDAEDVFHEALIVIFLQLRDKKLLLSCAFTTYLYSVVRLLWLNELRKRGRGGIAVGDCEDQVDQADDYYKTVEEFDRKALVLKCFNQLSENCQKVLGLFMTGYSIAEVTRAMGFSSDQHTKNRRFRCKHSLIEKIKLTQGYKELSNGENAIDNEVLGGRP